MDYFFKTIRENNKKFMVAVAYLALAAVGVVDAISTGLRPPGLFHGKAFKLAVVVIFVSVVALIVYKAVTEKRQKKQETEVEAEAAEFEPRREREIRELLKEKPDFNTHCYQCIHFNPDMLHCSRNMEHQRVKEIRIDNQKYCLYWVEAADPAAEAAAEST